jgi:hypothetical protein
MAERRRAGRRVVLDQVPMRDWADEAPRKAREGERVVEPLSPIPVQVWLKNPRGEVQVHAEALSWTSRQVRVRYIDLHSRKAWAWV